MTSTRSETAPLRSRFRRNQARPAPSGGATPLHFAAANGNPDAIMALLEKGAAIDARDSAFGETPLMWAAAYDRATAVQVLTAKGADLKAVSRVEDISAREKAERAALQ